MPTCTKCGKEILPEELYSKSGKTKYYKCPECRKACNKQYYEENREKELARGRAYKEQHKERLRAKQQKVYWENPEEARERARNSVRKHKERINQRKRERRKNPEVQEREREQYKIYRTSNKEKCNARKWVYRALGRNEIQRPELCSKCNQPGDIQAHHSNYDEPLNVTWLCHQCHADVHRELRLAEVNHSIEDLNS